MMSVQAPQTRVFIIDTSFFLRGVTFSIKSVDVAVPEEVAEEVRSRIPKLQMEKLLASGAMKIRGASNKAIALARQEAEKTGDLPNLSDADIGVIALAMELAAQRSAGIEPIVYTGDYAIQNVLKHKGIKFMTVGNDGISQVIKWVFKCEACDALFKKQPPRECPECGTEGMFKRVRG